MNIGTPDPDKKAAVGFEVTILKGQGRDMVVNPGDVITVPAEVDSVNIKITPVDIKGRAAEVEGKIDLAVTAGVGVVLLPSPDGTLCSIQWTAKGTQTVTISADADITPLGKKIITRSISTLTPPNVAAGFKVETV